MISVGYSLIRQGTVLQSENESLLFLDESVCNTSRVRTLIDEICADMESIEAEHTVEFVKDEVEVHVVTKSPYSHQCECDESRWSELRLLADEVKPTKYL